MFPGLRSYLTQHFPMLFQARTLTGTRYHFVVEVDGDDLVVRNVEATWFGGESDPQDNGETASGINTRINSTFFGCALPVDLGGPLGPKNPCQGSPLPSLPFFLPVVVTSRLNYEQVTVKFIDYGPSAPPKATAALDLTPSPFIALGGKIGIGRIPVDYRIIGGAKFLQS